MYVCMTNHLSCALSVLFWTLLASSLLCDRPIAGDVRGSGDTAPSSAFRVGSVAAERSYRVCSLLYLVRQCIPVEPVGGA